MPVSSLLALNEMFGKFLKTYFLEVPEVYLEFSRNSHHRCSIKNRVLKNFTKFTGKHLCQSLFFNKAAGLRSATLLKKRLWHRYFPVHLVKFSRIPFLQNISGWLLLTLSNISDRWFLKKQLTAKSHELFSQKILQHRYLPWS